MPRPKRSLQEIEPPNVNANATKSYITVKKARKGLNKSAPKSKPKPKPKPKPKRKGVIYGEESCPFHSHSRGHGKAYKDLTAEEKRRPKAHLEIAASTAERFQNRHPALMRFIKTYEDLQKDEMKELLTERGLKVSGRKDELIERLEGWDEEHPERKVGDDHREALARQPVPIGAKAEEMGPKEGSTLERIRKRGPVGPPVYDEMGFEVDYEKCTGMQPRSGPTGDDLIEQDRRENELKARVMGMQKEMKEGKVGISVKMAWVDRVSHDLNIPYHAVGPEQYEEWERRGFEKTSPSPAEWRKIGEREHERLMLLTKGSGLRKGSVR